MRRELIESYYEEYQRELERFLESDPEMFFSGSRNSSLHRYTGTSPQRCRTGDVAGIGQNYSANPFCSISFSTLDSFPWLVKANR